MVKVGTDEGLDRVWDYEEIQGMDKETLVVKSTIS